MMQTIKTPFSKIEVRSGNCTNKQREVIQNERQYQHIKRVPHFLKFIVDGCSACLKRILDPRFFSTGFSRSYRSIVRGSTPPEYS